MAQLAIKAKEKQNIKTFRNLSIRIMFVVDLLSMNTRKELIVDQKTSKLLFFTTFLGFASGLPLALSAGTLQAWLTVEGVDLRILGWLSLVGLPYTYKFFWAPILDRYKMPIGPTSRRRGWLIFFLFAMSITLFLFSFIDFANEYALIFVAILAILLAFLSSSFDVVFDAWRTEILPKKIMGYGAGWSVIGYRFAMITSGALALVIAELYFGFSGVYFLFGCIVLVFAMFVFLCPEEKINTSPKSLKEAFKEPFKEFFSRTSAILILVTIILYKLGDAFALSLSTAFLIRGAGFSPAEVGTVSKGVGLFAVLFGGLLGGWILSKVSLLKCLFWFGCLQAITNLGFWWLSITNPDLTDMAVVIILENLSGGMGTAAFVALLMVLCNKKYTATQFALLSALASIGRVFVGPLAGEIAFNFDWPIFFLFSFAVSIPGILMLFAIRKQVKKIQ